MFLITDTVFCNITRWDRFTQIKLNWVSVDVNVTDRDVKTEKSRSCGGAYVVLLTQKK